MSEKKVIVGLSGGVDSSVTALILLEQGHHVEGLFMKNWDEKSPDGTCMWEADVEDAMRVCDTLGIQLNTVDLSLEYWDGVFSHFLEEYKNGRTPNPDILCNQEIKFKAFLNHAFELGADMIATGHYARINKNNGIYQLLKGVDKNKDQSYFLCRLGQAQLCNILFPVGDLKKNPVREMAKNAGLITHDKKDSTGICFVGERHFREFLGRYIPEQTGEIQTTDGAIIGEHDGVFYYTLGQRQGLGIGGIKGANEEPWYVVGKNVEKNILYVAQGRDNPYLYSQRLIATNTHWISEQTPEIPLYCGAKTRYRQADQDCVIESINNDRCEVRFLQPQRAVTPGQYVVFYDKNICLGGGIIEKTSD
ncbi:MAG: tRNA (5-methylaminomethyl-2-thiouridylate)-methyltransferase [Gammaproteobacteria bacterium]|nr:tRNA (5-methylaminomethyl-2-thiouridylate)-methyltransferase [Gammaproteobacteria bacterium]